ncbi:MAG: cation:proton antiporter [Chloroflexi bacterium]|nr:cation:proton antiporter [Chloroflexota bacterium]
MENELSLAIMRLVYQLAALLIAAKLGGEVCVRYLKVPPVLGELVAGIIIGPFALGGLSAGGWGPLFPRPAAEGSGTAGIPLSRELYAFAQVASVVLLFVIGLETNLRQFLRYAGPGSLVAVGGVVLPFALGAWATVAFGFAASFTDPVALFMGAVLTATSVGITARVLDDLGKMDTPEGVTILAAAVIDDVLGILVLTVVAGVGEGEELEAGHVLWVGAKAVGFWMALMALGVLLSRPLSRLLEGFRSPGAAVALALALGLLAAGLAESFGLALIIGAYSIGLGLSQTTLAQHLAEPLKAVYHALVPVFFAAMGMMVDLPAMGGALAFGLVITLLATVSKVVGAGLPAAASGFNVRGVLRVGVGMLPRGEVALIIAGIGLTRGIVDADIFGVAILMTAVTTLVAPPLLAPLFRHGGSGRRGTRRPEAGPAPGGAESGP